jgi:hypothetical protein
MLYTHGFVADPVRTTVETPPTTTTHCPLQFADYTNVKVKILILELFCPGIRPNG